LASSPAFVPLLGELMGRLVGRPRMTDAVACGEPMAVHLPTSVGSAAGLRVVGPDGRHDAVGQLHEEGGSVLWRAGSLPVPGVYQVLRGDVVLFALAAAVPAEESDLRPLESSVLPDRLAGGRTLQ